MKEDWLAACFEACTGLFLVYQSDAIAVLAKRSAFPALMFPYQVELTIAGNRILAYALYIDPPLGRAAVTEAQVKQSGQKALLATGGPENLT